MATYIVLASALAVIQFWVIPFLINVKNLNWQMSNRDESLDDSVLLKRARVKAWCAKKIQLHAPFKIS